MGPELTAAVQVRGGRVINDVGTVAEREKWVDFRYILVA